MQEFEEIYAEYFLRVFRYVMGLCGNADLAEEITQQAFFKAYKSIDSFKAECKIGSWLCAIAKNCYFSHLQQEKKRRGLPRSRIDLTNMEEKLLEKDAAMDVHHALHRLNEPYREVFWLKIFGELSFKQISELFGKTESWARVTYYRAKLMIREELE